MGLEELTKGVRADRKGKWDPQTLRDWGKGTSNQDREGVATEVGENPGRAAVFKDKQESISRRG